MDLHATSGPLTGTTIHLTDGVTIADIDSDHPACRIGRAPEGGFQLQALDGQQPVFVNGLPVTTRVLESRDELRIGDSLWVAREEQVPPPSALMPCPARVQASSRVRGMFELGFEDALLSPQNGTGTREARDLATLLRVGGALSAIHGLATIDAALAGLVLDIVPAERVVFGSGDGVPLSVQ